jgi:hypothetical protein
VQEMETLWKESINIFDGFARNENFMEGGYQYF